jgi:two-component system, LytTR family, response regulator
MTKIRTLIVDDEPVARARVLLLLGEEPDIEVVGECDRAPQAVSVIAETSPDLMFLDVQMPEMDGFSVVQEIGPERMPAVVFVTAHDQYAIRAFEINAIDYLLKPVTVERFAQSIERAKARLRTSEPHQESRQILSLLETIASPPRYLKRMAVQSAGKTCFIGVEDVDWIRAAENYVELHVAQASHLLHVTMNTLEKSLDPETFVRIHRSLIVNLRRVKEIQPMSHGDYVLLLESGLRLQSGRTYHERIKALMANPF